MLKASDVQPADDPARTLADEREKGIEDALLAMLAGLAALFAGDAVLRMIARLDIRGLAALLDSDAARDLYVSGYQPVADTFLAAARQAANDNLPGVFAYDPLAAAPALQALRDELTSAIAAAARQTIREGLLAGLRGGLDAETVAARLRQVIGLDVQSARAVANYRELLERGDMTALRRALRDRRYDELVRQVIRGQRKLAPDVIDKMVQAYAERMLAFRARRMAATEAMQAAVSGIRDAHLQAVKSGRLFDSEVKRFWLTAADERVCPVCSSVPVMNEDGVGVSDQYRSIDGPIDAPLAHPWCFPAGTLVQASNISAATKRWYDGDLIVVQTASGKSFACTPNHPILTREGWVGAARLNVGSYVICDGVGDGMPTGGHNHQHIPTRIEEVASSFRRSGKVTASEVPTTAEHFHGDGEGSKIAIVWADRELLRPFDPTLTKQIDEMLLNSRDMMATLLHRLSSQQAFVQRLFSATRSFVRGLSEPLAFGRLCAAHAYQHGFGSVGRNDLSFLQYAADDGSRHAELNSRLFDGHLSPNERNHSNFVNLGARSLVWPSSVASSQAALERELVKRGDADAIMARQILKGRFGPVASDKVVHVERRPFSGHVFNLETATGWYLAEGIVTHNCRCSERYVADVSRLTEQPFPLAA